MKFLIDMPLSPVLAQWLTGRGHEASHLVLRGLQSAEDETILRIAREEDAIVLTADLDYPRLLILTGSDGPGILLFRGGDWREDEILARLGHALTNIPRTNSAIRSLSSSGVAFAEGDFPLLLII